MNTNVVNFRANKIVNAINKVDMTIYGIFNKLTTTQLQKLVDDAGLYVPTSDDGEYAALRDTVRRAYDIGDIQAESIFDVYEN